MASDLRNDHDMEGDIQKESTDLQGTAADDSQASDNDGGERPVRNKLKETSITASPNPPTEQPQEGGNTSRASSRGRKRSFDDNEPEKCDVENDDLGHRRKRSRDSSYEEANAASSNAERTQPEESTNVDGLSKTLGPKKKRSRDQLDKDENKAEDAVARPEAQHTSTEEGASTEKSTGEREPEKKRHRDNSQERDSAAVPNAFANASTVSPFGSLGTSKLKEAEEPSKPATMTSSSAFASSSLAAFASSEQSPFGSLGGSTTSVFKSPATTEAGKPAATAFAAAAGTSGFAALGSGFSGFHGGFGASESKGGLTSFASPGAPSLFGSSSKKPFGATEDEEEESKDEDGDNGLAEFEQDKTDERFFERPIETGEEEEKTYFSCKAKLFQFSDGEWRERGIGTFKVNVKVTDGKEDKNTARLIMRADGVLRVMLNTPIFKGMNVGDASGNEPKSKQIHLASLESGRSVPILLRTGSEDLAKELYQVVCDLLEEQ
ncbi:hypothetical protein EYZ11_010055 [Aspergillus tanneri]|uniref:RanBD1 domain-containing protein n=1 Tax=Aspergillus tanneri TaxID=1220188 RepID=A0A4S3J6A4_9EURO|nr:uncharacterized protein ATNIH1004_003276 [Aspergillus tanneri]KAA8650589.1 hypothetical protein ATNIH1004_003276 [Aspergillus tanneri]THC90476.1 hypothetical protein EYZ11_010055 [Aspergillus tanneri]